MNFNKCAKVVNVDMFIVFSYNAPYINKRSHKMANEKKEKVSVLMDKDVHKRLKYLELDNDCASISEAIKVALDAYDKKK